MEEKMWVISKKGEKLSDICIIIIGMILGLIVYFYPYSNSSSFFRQNDLYFILLLILAAIMVYFWIKYFSNWQNPKIIKIRDNTIITEEKLPNGKIERYGIPLDGIYRMTIKRRETLIEYRTPDGKEFIWRLIRPGYAREDKKKLEEILEEIIKRINKKDVRIVQRR